jgi:hypothetical protein
MNGNFHERWETMDERLLDRFVDGAMCESEQRELLACAEADPRLWRSLALAFAEAQFWGREMGGIAGGARAPRETVLRETATPLQIVAARAAHDKTVAPIAISRAASRGASAWLRPLMLVASLLVAVGMGIGVGQQWTKRQYGGMHSSDPVAKNNRRPLAPIDEIAEQRSDNVGPSMMTFVADDGTSIQVPVYDAAHYNGADLAQQSSGVPREVLRALRSTGHEVKKQQRLWPIELGDGRRVVVPVEQLDVQYVGNRAFQ